MWNMDTHSWTGTKDSNLETRCYRKIFGISFRDRIKNEEVRNRIRAAIGPHDGLLTIVKTRQLRWYGHFTWSTGLTKTIMQGTVPGGRRRGRPKKPWDNNIKEWTELPLANTLRLTEDKDDWRKIVKTSVVPLQPPSGYGAKKKKTRTHAHEAENNIRLGNERNLVCPKKSNPKVIYDKWQSDSTRGTKGHFQTHADLNRSIWLCIVLCMFLVLRHFCFIMSVCLFSFSFIVLIITIFIALLFCSCAISCSTYLLL